MNRKQLHRVLWSSLSVVAITAVTSQAAVISFQQGVSPSASYDAPATEVISTSADTNYGVSGSNSLLVGYNNGASSIYHSLLSFDLSAINAAAGGNPVTINSAQLNLHTSDGSSGNTVDVNLNQYDFDFNEAVATWNDPDGDGGDTTGDPTDGGTLGTFLSQAAGVSGQNTDVTFSDTAAFRAAVTGALASPGETLNLILTGDDNATKTQFARFADEDFDSSSSTAGSSGTINDRPELVVDFTAVPEPASLALMGLGGLAMLGRRRRSGRA